MSENVVDGFFEAATRDPVAVKQLMAAADVEAVVRIAAEHGFQFSAEELLQARPDFRPYAEIQVEVDERQGWAQALTALARGGETQRPKDPGPDDPDPNPPTDPPPPTINQIRVLSFTVTPTRIGPKSGGATVAWSVDVPAGLWVTLAINDVPVSRSGSMHVDPVASTLYALTATHIGISHLLSTAVLTVDNPPECLDEMGLGLDLFHDLSVAQALVQYGGAGQRFGDGAFSVIVRMESADDLDVSEDGGLVRFTWRLIIDDLLGADGGTVTSRIWIRPWVHYGTIMGYVDHSDTDFNLPPDLWWLVVFGGPVAWALLGFVSDTLVNRVDPALRDATNAAFAAIAIALGNRVISVRVTPETGGDPTTQNLVATVRKRECM